MKNIAAIFALAASFACADPAVTFGRNYNSAYITRLNQLGIPMVPVPQVQMFIAGNVKDGTAAYYLIAVYDSGDGIKSVTSTPCLASSQPFDNQGNTTTMCVVYLDAPTTVEVKVISLPGVTVRVGGN